MAGPPQSILFFDVRLKYPSSTGSTLYVFDQENLDERNHFAARMKDIYENARTAVIWLGTGVEGAEESFETIDNYTYIADLGLDKTRRWGLKPKDAVLLEVFFYRHPYWGRGWILQEASTPHDSVVSMSLTEVWYGR